MATTFILGAGFSMEAKYPSGHTLNEKFFASVENKLLKSSSGEWLWDEYDEVTSHNGKLNSDYLNISYLLSELIEVFQKETLLPFDYEEFYDWIYKADFPIELLKTSCANVNRRLKTNFPSIHSSYLFSNPGATELYQIKESYVYLIADILRRAYEREEKSKFYTPFINLVSGGSSNIFTLNHDTLLEYLLEKNDVHYSDGFSTFESIIINEEKRLLPVFNNAYTEKIKLHKLHGSIDYYCFQELSQSVGGVYYNTPNYWFFKTNRYWDIHLASKIDPTTQEIIQYLNTDIKPQFLTGKSKLTIINDHLFYKKLYAHLKESLQTTNKLILIGYSYRDVHINALVKEFLEMNPCEVINVNPHVSFPFRRNYSQHNILEIKSISSL